MLDFWGRPKWHIFTFWHPPASINTFTWALKIFQAVLLLTDTVLILCIGFEVFFFIKLAVTEGQEQILCSKNSPRWFWPFLPAVTRGSHRYSHYQDWNQATRRWQWLSQSIQIRNCASPITYLQSPGHLAIKGFSLKAGRKKHDMIWNSSRFITFKHKANLM